MGKKFLEGLAFGAGFAIAFVVLAWLAVSWMVPKTWTPPEALHESGPVARPAERPFHEMPLEEQIAKASVIALARYERAPDGKMKAIIKDFLKKEPGTTLYYELGDEYVAASFYPDREVPRGDGVVIFFVGSPAEMRLSVSFSGDRIRGLGDIPLTLFRQKCEKAA